MQELEINHIADELYAMQALYLYNLSTIEHFLHALQKVRIGLMSEKKVVNIRSEMLGEITIELPITMAGNLNVMQSPFSVIQLDMSSDVVKPGESLVTNSTAVRFVPGMNHQMASQIASIGEPFPAVFATMSFLSRMG